MALQAEVHNLKRAGALCARARRAAHGDDTRTSADWGWTVRQTARCGVCRTHMLLCKPTRGHLRWSPCLNVALVDAATMAAATSADSVNNVGTRNARLDAAAVAITALEAAEAPLPPPASTFLEPPPPPPPPPPFPGLAGHGLAIAGLPPKPKIIPLLKMKQLHWIKVPEPMVKGSCNFGRCLNASGSARERAWALTC